MTYKEVSNMISSIGLPYAYYQFPDGTDTAPPFICFLYDGSHDLAADDTNYQRIRPLVIELYTDSKDFALENSVETVLNQYGFAYSREETYLDSEKMHMVSFTTEVVITDEPIINTEITEE